MKSDAGYIGLESAVFVIIVRTLDLPDDFSLRGALALIVLLRSR